MALWLHSPRRWLTILALPLLLVLSACDASQHLTVNSDGSASVASTLLIDNSLLTNNGQSLDSALATLQSDSQKSNPQAKVSIIKGTSQSGISVTQSYSSVQAAVDGLTQQPAASSGQPGGMFKSAAYSHSNGTDHFTFRYEPPSGSQTGSIPVSSLYTVHFSLTLPTKIAKSSPAPTYSDDGHTATWSVPLDKPETITADGTPPTNPLVYVLLAVAVLAVLVAGYYYWQRRRTPPAAPVAMAPTSPSPVPEVPQATTPPSSSSPAEPPQS